MKEHLVSRSQIPSLPRDVSSFLEKYCPLPVEDDGDGIAVILIYYQTVFLN
jgi:hypothetical protein